MSEEYCGLGEECYFDENTENSSHIIQCDQCKNWFHPNCGQTYEALWNDFVNWYCTACKESNPNLHESFKKIVFPYLQDHFRRPEHLSDPDQFQVKSLKGGEFQTIIEIATGKPVVECGTPQFVKELKKVSLSYSCGRTKFDAKKHNALYFNEKYLDDGKFKHPLVFKFKDGSPPGLEIKNLTNYRINTVEQVKHVLGPGHDLTYFDCRTQTEYMCGMQEFADYLSDHKDSVRTLGNPNKMVNYVFNVIALEFSKSPLSEDVRPPFIFSGSTSVSWNDLWPTFLHGRTTENTEDERPSFMKYCLMGAKNSYTDWHIDLGGSSVWYHIVRGGKLFILVRPTDKNLKKYLSWENLNFGEETRFKKMRCSFIQYCDEINDPIIPEDLYKVELAAGDTMFVPSGWIHCVVTTEDSLVFGGNFLHPYCAAMQINIRTLEEQMRIPKKNLITGFDKLNWYGLERLLSELEEALEEDSSLDKIKRRTKKKDKFPIVKFEAIDVISRYLFDKTGNLEDIPDSIDEPKTLIKTIRKLSKLPSLK